MTVSEDSPQTNFFLVCWGELKQPPSEQMLKLSHTNILMSSIFKKKNLYFNLVISGQLVSGMFRHRELKLLEASLFWGSIKQSFPTYAIF